MAINAALSQLYGTNKTMLGANQKVVSKETYAKEVGNAVVLRFKTSSGTRYIVKMNGEEEERLAVIILKENKCFILATQEGTHQSLEDNCYFCELEKIADKDKKYKVTNGPLLKYRSTVASGLPFGAKLSDECKRDMSYMLNILLRAEKDDEYKKMIFTAIEAIK